MKKSLVYVGLDVHKDSIVVAMAAGRQPAVVVQRISSDWGQLGEGAGQTRARSGCGVCYEPAPPATS